jgi:carbamoyl-phosphate synthase large subunit
VTTRATVLVTAVGGVGVGEQIVKALRIAGGYRIIGTDVNPHCVNFDVVDQAVVLPAASDPEYLEALLVTARAHGVEVVFPGSEPELKVLSAQRDLVADAGLLLPIAPRDVIDTCMDKLKTSAFLAAQGMDHPRFASVTMDSLAAIDWFPVVVKPAVGGGGSVDCYVAQSPRELACLAELMGGRSGTMMVQEYVGTPDCEFTVGVLHDLDGALVNSIAVHRDLHSQLNVRTRVANRTGRKELGPSLVLSSGYSHGTIGRFPDVTGPSERIAAALGVTGPVNVQCRLVDGVVKVFEINPRYSGTTSLRAMVGYNEPDLMIRRHLFGETLPLRFPYAAGTIHRSLIESFVREQAAPLWSATAG